MKEWTVFRKPLRDINVITVLIILWIICALCFGIFQLSQQVALHRCVVCGVCIFFLQNSFMKCGIHYQAPAYAVIKRCFAARWLTAHPHCYIVAVTVRLAVLQSKLRLVIAWHGRNEVNKPVVHVVNVRNALLHIQNIVPAKDNSLTWTYRWHILSVQQLAWWHFNTLAFGNNWPVWPL